MSRRAIRAIPLRLNCDNYLNGHHLHWVYERASHNKEPGQPCNVTDVADDGTITFADGSTCWHHGPHRLRIASHALFCALGVRHVQSAFDPMVVHCFRVDGAASRCLLPRVVPGESIAAETARRSRATRGL